MSNDLEITIKDITPGKDELASSLWVKLKCAFNLANTCHLNITGLMYSSDNKYLCYGTQTTPGEGQYASPQPQKISDCNTVVDSNSDNELHFETTLRFPVDTLIFNHIENLRMGDTNRDVHLNFLIKVTMIEHNFSVNNNNAVTLRVGQKSLGNKKLYEIFEFKYPIKNHKIPSGDWINMFMEPLGFGKIIVFEINEPTISQIPVFPDSEVDVKLFKERLEAALSSLHRMETHLKKGEWNHVAEQLRGIQLFKSDMKQGLKKLLSKTTNLPNEKCQLFTEAIDRLYDVSSQFHHLVDNGKVNPVMNVNKEDAYFVYMFMLSITQLISSKLEILWRNNISINNP
jgi:hypothetical protein